MAQPRNPYYTLQLSRAFDLRGQPSFDLDDRIAPVYNLAPQDTIFQPGNYRPAANTTIVVGSPSPPSVFDCLIQARASNLTMFSGIALVAWRLEFDYSWSPGTTENQLIISVRQTGSVTDEHIVVRENTTQSRPFRIRTPWIRFPWEHQILLQYFGVVGQTIDGVAKLLTLP